MSQIRSHLPRPPTKKTTSSNKKKSLPEIKNNNSEYSSAENGGMCLKALPQSQTATDQKQHKSRLSNQTGFQMTFLSKKKEIDKQLIIQDQENQANQANFGENPQAPELAVEPITTQDITQKIRKKYLVFRAYEDPIKIRPYQPTDRGYYFKLHNCDVKIIRYTLEDNGFRDLPAKDSKDWTVMWSCSALKSHIYSQLTKYQKVNHFPQSFYLTRKDLMYKQVSKMREMHGQKHFNFIPKTFLLPNEYIYLEAEMVKDKEKIWIAKPSASSQGKGIIVTNKLSEIPNRGNPYIVSEYINNPLLFDGYKFDMRIYVAITCINPLRLYIYEEGLTRFATSKYKNTCIGNKKQSRFTHLTNYSLNKYNPNFITNSDSSSDNVGSKWSLTALRKAMREQGVDDIVIWKKIEDIIVKTILSVEPMIFQAVDQYVPFRSNCFELLGFDILIDNNLDPWLIEVNLSPSLACDSPMDHRVKGNLISDVFTLVGIVPLEQRKIGSDAILIKKQGMYCGAYQLNDLNKSSLNYNKRDSSTAQGKRRDKSLLQDTNGFAYGAVKVQALSQKQERQLVKETENEFKRKGNFKRVFPSLDYGYYKQFFVEERLLNNVIDQKVMGKRRLSNAVTSAMTMKQKIEYLNSKSSLLVMQNPSTVTKNGAQKGKTKPESEPFTSYDKPQYCPLKEDLIDIDNV